MNQRVVHFEIPCDDPVKTMAFFRHVFNWTFQQFGDQEYWFAVTGDEKMPGINGGLMKKRDPNQPVANTINVTNIDETMDKIEKSGGVIVLPKMPIPTVGWVAYFKDPDGNIHGIHQADPKAE